MAKVLGYIPKTNASKMSTWVKWVIFMDNCECTNVSRSSPNSRSPYLAHMAIDVYEHQNES